jgi:DNA-directed RNA polymerase specialized sigma subunit
VVDLFVSEEVTKLQRKPKLRELIALAKNGDEEAMTQVVKRFIPIVKKYSRQLGYKEACSDLVIWILEAVHRYQPNTV